MNLIPLIALGIALSACCGFRIFIPMLAAAIGGYNHWFELPSDMQWLGSLPAIICFGTAAVVEVVAYYFPFLDNILDTVATPVAVIAGTLLASAIIPLPEGQPVIRWGLAILAGGSTAGILQGSLGLLRLFSTKATLGTGNPVVASGENVAAVTFSVLSFIIPVIAALLVLAIVGWFVWQGIRRLTSGKSNYP
ncbi:MAG: DUF4126 domain-containing protein [Gemmatimonadaceae bacterium]|nr:DUF4126 domain-containing protein [Chitinophagaceae bacterium]